MDDKKCVICRCRYVGYGNNTQPVKSGQCCDKCNMKVVIPKRIEAIKTNGSW